MRGGRVRPSVISQEAKANLEHHAHGWLDWRGTCQWCGQAVQGSLEDCKQHAATCSKRNEARQERMAQVAEERAHRGCEG